jgi:hypothetical protein
MALTYKQPGWTASFTTADTEEPQSFTEEFSVSRCAIAVSRWRKSLVCLAVVASQAHSLFLPCVT